MANSITETMEWKFLVTNGELPEKRSHHTSVVSGNRLIVFGGLSQEGKRLNDIHVLDLGMFNLFSSDTCHIDLDRSLERAFF